MNQVDCNMPFNRSPSDAEVADVLSAGPVSAPVVIRALPSATAEVVDLT